LAAICPVSRSTSSVGRAIDFMLGMPVFTSKTLTNALKITDRGAKEVLDKLLDADILEIEGSTKQNRLFVCRRTL
jgi:predicted HTH transcriptional regulator